MKKMVLKLFVLIVPFYFLVSVSLYFFPMRFMDGEYAWYENNRQYALQSDEYNKILITGDSTGKSAWIPLDFSQDTYNYALGGTTPIEEYYFLREYLQHHPAPEYLFYTTSAAHFKRADTLWDRSVYFHRMDINDVHDFLQTLEASGDYSAIKGNNSESDLMLYATYSPLKYSTAFVMGLLFRGRYEENNEKMTSVKADKGYNQFGKAEYCNDTNYYVDYDSFQESEIIDYYFRKMIELCEENDIHFIFQNPPLNVASFNGLNDQFVSDYKAYLSGIQKDYPDIDVDLELYCYDGSYFGDKTHLNERGAKLFTSKMREKYNYIFEEAQL